MADPAMANMQVVSSGDTNSSSSPSLTERLSHFVSDHQHPVITAVSQVNRDDNFAGTDVVEVILQTETSDCDLIKSYLSTPKMTLTPSPTNAQQKQNTSTTATSLSGCTLTIKPAQTVCGNQSNQQTVPQQSEQIVPLSASDIQSSFNKEHQNGYDNTYHRQQQKQQMQHFYVDQGKSPNKLDHHGDNNLPRQMPPLLIQNNLPFEQQQKSNNSLHLNQQLQDFFQHPDQYLFNDLALNARLHEKACMQQQQSSHFQQQLSNNPKQQLQADYQLHIRSFLEMERIQQQQKHVQMKENLKHKIYNKKPSLKTNTDRDPPRSKKSRKTLTTQSLNIQPPNVTMGTYLNERQRECAIQMIQHQQKMIYEKQQEYLMMQNTQRTSLLMQQHQMMNNTCGLQQQQIISPLSYQQPTTNPSYSGVEHAFDQSLNKLRQRANDAKNGEINNSQYDQHQRVSPYSDYRRKPIYNHLQATQHSQGNHLQTQQQLLHHPSASDYASLHHYNSFLQSPTPMFQAAKHPRSRMLHYNNNQQQQHHQQQQHQQQQQQQQISNINHRRLFYDNNNNNNNSMSPANEMNNDNTFFFMQQHTDQFKKQELEQERTERLHRLDSVLLHQEKAVDGGETSLRQQQMKVPPPLILPSSSSFIMTSSIKPASASMNSSLIDHSSPDSGRGSMIDPNEKYNSVSINSASFETDDHNNNDSPVVYPDPKRDRGGKFSVSSMISKNNSKLHFTFDEENGKKHADSFLATSEKENHPILTLNDIRRSPDAELISPTSAADKRLRFLKPQWLSNNSKMNSWKMRQTNEGEDENIVTSSPPPPRSGDEVASVSSRPVSVDSNDVTHGDNILSPGNLVIDEDSLISID